MKVAMKERPLALHVCTLNPMILKQYHTISSIVQNLKILSFITICKDTKILQMAKVHAYTKKEEEFENPSSRPVPMIGVEPTRREALAPETSVSTISPHGLQ